MAQRAEVPLKAPFASLETALREAAKPDAQISKEAQAAVSIDVSVKLTQIEASAGYYKDLRCGRS